MKTLLLNIAALLAAFGGGVAYADQVKAFVTGIPADLKREATIAYNAVLAKAAIEKSALASKADAILGASAAVSGAAAAVDKAGQDLKNITGGITADIAAQVAKVAAAKP